VNNILFKPKPTVYGGSIKFSRDYLIEGLGGRSAPALLVRQLITMNVTGHKKFFCSISFVVVVVVVVEIMYFGEKVERGAE
jgi:hypothetical protein